MSAAVTRADTTGSLAGEAMATKKSKAPQRSRALTKNQRELKALAKLGVYKGDWRSAREATGSQKKLRAKFKDQMADIEAGKIKAVKVPKGAETAGMPKARGKVLVRAEKGERISYNKKSGTFGSIVYRDGVKFRRVILPMDPEKAGQLLHRKGLYYMVPFKQMGISSPLFEDPEQLAKFMADYEKKRFKDWLNYVEVYELVNQSDADEVDAYDA